MDQILAKLLDIPGAQGSLVVGKDGLVVAFAGQTDPDTDSLGAIAAELLNHVESALPVMGNLTNLSVEGESCQIHVAAINEVTYLLLMTKGGPGLGRIRVELSSACKALREEL